MQLNRLSTFALLALAGVVFQVASAVPTYELADPKSPGSDVQLASPQEQVSRGKDAAQDPTAATQPGTSDSTGSTTTPQPIGDPIHAAASSFDPSTMSQTEPTLPGIAGGTPEILYRISNYLSDGTRTSLRKVSRAVRNAVDLDPAGQPDLLQRCLYEKWDALQKDDAVQKLKAAVVRTTAATVLADAELAAADAASDANPDAYDDYRIAQSVAREAESQMTAAKFALLDVVAASAVWTECVTEVYPSATIKPCPHSKYQLVGNNGEYTPLTGPAQYWGLRLAQNTSANVVRGKKFASLLCQLAENDAFYWLKQLVKEAPKGLSAASLYALIHIVQLTTNERMAEQVQAILQSGLVMSGKGWAPHYYDPVMEHYLFVRNPSLLPTAVYEKKQLQSGILTRLSVTRNRPLPYFAPWYKTDEPTELIMPRVQLPATGNDDMAFVKHVAQTIRQRDLHEAAYPNPDAMEFPVIEQPGPGDAYQLPTPPDQLAATTIGVVAEDFSSYEDSDYYAFLFDLIAAYYTTGEAIQYYDAVYKDALFYPTIVMATRSTEGTELLEHVFAHVYGKPGVKLLEHPSIAGYVNGPKGYKPNREAKLHGMVVASMVECAQMCSKDVWPTFKKLMADKLATLTPAQMDMCKGFAKEKLWRTKTLLKKTEEVMELPDDQCTTLEQRDECAAYRVVSLLRQGKSAVQAN